MQLKLRTWRALPSVYCVTVFLLSFYLFKTLCKSRKSEKAVAHYAFLTTGGIQLENSFLQCPICGQIDAVQKISAVVASGTSHGTTTTLRAAPMPLRGGYIVTSGQTPTVNQTELSRRLSFPKHSNGGLITLVITAIVLAPLSYCGTTSFLTFNYMSSDNSHLDGASFASAAASYRLLEIGIPLILLALAVLLIGYIVIKKMRENPQRLQALTIWNRLFYCNRDDTVFVPGDTTMVTTSSNMRNLINY